MAKCSLQCQVTDLVSAGHYLLLLIIYHVTNYELESRIWFIVQCSMNIKKKNHFMNLYTFDVIFIALAICVCHFHSSLSLLSFCWINTKIFIFDLMWENEKENAIFFIFFFAFGLQSLWANVLGWLNKHIIYTIIYNQLEINVRNFKKSNRLCCFSKKQSVISLDEFDSKMNDNNNIIKR